MDITLGAFGTRAAEASEPATCRERVRRAAYELGYFVFDACKGWYSKEALVLVPKEFGHRVMDTLLVWCSPKVPRGRVRALETTSARYVERVEGLEYFSEVPLSYYSLDHAINAFGRGLRGEPGGPFAWWELCTKASLEEHEVALGPLPRQRLIRHRYRNLEQAIGKVRAAAPTRPRVMPERGLRAVDQNRGYDQHKPRP